MSDDELKPCPFCGGEARDGKDREYFLVRCTHCGAEQFSDIRRVAVSSWNRRADLLPTPAEAMRCPEVMALVEAMRPFAEAAMHLHPATPNDATTLDGIDAGQWRAAYASLSALEKAVRHE